jgi:hypothetical protein
MTQERLNLLPQAQPGVSGVAGSSAPANGETFAELTGGFGIDMQGRNPAAE